MGLEQLRKKFNHAVTRPLLGVYEYYAKPELRLGFGGPFNVQTQRQALFKEIIAKLDIDHILETGTFRGTTTQFMFDEAGLPLYSTETGPKLWAFSAQRFLFNSKVKLFNQDSRAFLKNMLQKQSVQQATNFFYLDAHWGEDLPLQEEVDIICRANDRAVIMIDDFQVPDDDGYTYDDYGPGKVLCLDLLKDLIAQYELTVFFPQKSSEEETGGKRGCVVMTNHNELAEELEACALLRAYAI